MTRARRNNLPSNAMKRLPAIIVLTLGSIFASHVSASAQPAVPAEMVRGHVRMVLMSVGQTTVFLNSPTQPDPKSKHAVPCFTLTYLLEFLGDKPFKTTQSGQIEITSGGKPFEPVNFQHGNYQKSFDYRVYPDFLDFTKPKVTNASRAIIFQNVTFAAIPSLEPFDLLIRAGFDDEIQDFKFNSISLKPEHP
jgi:hypothetical protein